MSSSLAWYRVPWRPPSDLGLPVLRIGYPWMVIRVEDRTAYLATLDRASIDLNIVPSAEFIADHVR